MNNVHRVHENARLMLSYNICIAKPQARWHFDVEAILKEFGQEGLC